MKTRLLAMIVFLVMWLFSMAPATISAAEPAVKEYLYIAVVDGISAQKKVDGVVQFNFQGQFQEVQVYLDVGQSVQAAAVFPFTQEGDWAVTFIESTEKKTLLRLEGHIRSVPGDGGNGNAVATAGFEAVFNRTSFEPNLLSVDASSRSLVLSVGHSSGAIQVDLDMRESATIKVAIGISKEDGITIRDDDISEEERTGTSIAVSTPEYEVLPLRSVYSVVVTKKTQVIAQATGTYDFVQEVDFSGGKDRITDIITRMRIGFSRMPKVYKMEMPNEYIVKGSVKAVMDEKPSVATYREIGGSQVSLNAISANSTTEMAKSEINTTSGWLPLIELYKPILIAAAIGIGLLVIFLILIFKR